jgi:hypothetical protein
MAYIPPTGTISRTITVDMSSVKAKASATWFNPATGIYTSIGVFMNSGSLDFTTPGDNGLSQNDWVLILETGQ